jgi:hypothetical protein
MPRKGNEKMLSVKDESHHVIPLSRGVQTTVRFGD